MPSTNPQLMQVGGYTFVNNPSFDSEFEYPIAMASFLPIGAGDDLIQVFGFHSGQRAISGILFADADFRSLETIFRAGSTTSVTDFLGNTFYAFITKFKPKRNGTDLLHGFQTIEYDLSFIKRPSLL